MNTQNLIRNAERITELLGRAISLFSMLIMLLTAAVVVMRYGFEIGTITIFGADISSIALQETVLYMHAALFMLASGYTLKHNGHVRVDVFYRNFSARGKAIVDLLGSLFLLTPVCILIFYVSLDFVEFSWKMNEHSQEALGLPWVWAVKALIPLMAVVILFQGLLEALKNGLYLLGKGPSPAPEEGSAI